MTTAKKFAVLSFALLVLTVSGTALAGPIDDAKAALEKQDYTTALGLLQPLAEQGSAEAQYYLGFRYYHGEGAGGSTGDGRVESGGRGARSSRPRFAP